MRTTEFYKRILFSNFSYPVTNNKKVTDVKDERVCALIE